MYPTESFGFRESIRQVFLIRLFRYLGLGLISLSANELEYLNKTEYRTDIHFKPVRRLVLRSTGLIIEELGKSVAGVGFALDHEICSALKGRSPKQISQHYSKTPLSSPTENNLLF